MRTIKELAQSVDPTLKRLDGLVRRMAVTIAGAKAIWQVSGFRQLDGTTETRSIEVFSGVGVYARPPASGNPEAIAVMVGDSKVPIAVAVRDEKTRAAVAGDLEADETALFNSQALIIIKADGSVEIRSKNGTAVPLATKADVAALKSVFDSHGHISAASGSPTTKPGTTAFMTAPGGSMTPVEFPDPVGTTKLRGE